MSNEEKKVETVTIKITLPTKETIIETLSKLFPGISVEVEKKKTEESTVET
ncbi:hypothetical protein GH146_02155 [archaeon]|nr:hypothetical protein [archaeon]